MNVLDLFSGIGGFSLGLERAGMRTVAFCEIDPYCRAVLRKHWPTVPVHDDVRTLTATAWADAARHVCAEQEASGSEWQRTGPSSQPINVICGGFPCQDISLAGKGAGITGERSGLWSEFARLIGEIRPRYVVVENVAALLGRGIERVLGDLAALGFDAEWHCIPASAVGAPHRRDRVWIIGSSADTGRQLLEGWQSEGTNNRSEVLADASEQSDGRSSRLGWRLWSALHDPSERGRGDGPCDVQWLIEPNVGRVAHGIPSRVDRLRSLGNAVVPQVVEIIGRAIMAGENLATVKE